MLLLDGVLRLFHGKGEPFIQKVTVKYLFCRIIDKIEPTSVKRGNFTVGLKLRNGEGAKHDGLGVR